MCKNQNDVQIEIDELNGAKGECSCVDEIIDCCADGDDTSKPETIRELMIENLDRLTPREQAVMRLRLGLEDGVCHTREELSEMFGVKCERIRQIEHKAQRGYKHLVRHNKLREFLSDSECE